MALHWDLTAIKNYRDLCFLEDDEGGRRLSIATETLIWGSMTIGIREITEKNALEFYLRLHYWESLHGPFISRGGAYTDYGTVKNHIGLRTNASEETRAQFLKRVTTRFFEDAEYKIQSNPHYRKNLDE